MPPEDESGIKHNPTTNTAPPFSDKNQIQPQHEEEVKLNLDFEDDITTDPQ